MSGANDKARFYLEQGVPQLQDFEQKKIFTKVSRLFPSTLYTPFLPCDRVLIRKTLFRMKLEH